MLTRIYCEKFGETVPGKTIRFEKGLNIVLGADGNTNSIGKSTALLIIDFCFGGNTYPKQDDVIANVGHHIIYFTFRFNGQDYEMTRTNTQWSAKVDGLKEGVNSFIVIPEAGEPRQISIEFYGLGAGSIDDEFDI